MWSKNERLIRADFFDAIGLKHIDVGVEQSDCSSET